MCNAQIIITSPSQYEHRGECKKLQTEDQLIDRIKKEDADLLEFNFDEEVNEE